MKKRERESSVDELVQRILKNHPSFTASPLGNWQDLVGQQVGQRSQPVSLKKKVLMIVAHDSIWKHHLELNREALIEKINRGRPEPIVEQIVIRVGELPERAPPLNPDFYVLDNLGPTPYRSRKKKKAPTRPLTVEEKELLKNLSDVELRKIGRRLLRRLPE